MRKYRLHREQIAQTNVWSPGFAVQGTVGDRKVKPAYAKWNSQDNIRYK